MGMKLTILDLYVEFVFHSGLLLHDWTKVNDMSDLDAQRAALGEFVEHD